MTARFLPALLFSSLQASPIDLEISADSSESRKSAQGWLTDNGLETKSTISASSEWNRPNIDDSIRWLNSLPQNGPRNPLPGRSFFFGDSLSDTGNISDLLNGLGPAYPGTSFTNGTTWVRYLEPSVLRLQETLPTDPGRPLANQSSFGPTDLSVGGATTQTILDQQIKAIFNTYYGSTPRDRAFIWGGGNDILDVLVSGSPPSPAQIASTIATGVANLTESVEILSNSGFQDITVISLTNIGLSPRADGLEAQGARITEIFNTNLKQSLQSKALPSRLLWIDVDSLFNDAFNNPSVYRLTNVTDPAAPQAADGIPSPLSLEEQNTHLFYDDIHPTTGVHEQLARFVSLHLSLADDVDSLFLVTDVATALDDHFGFENQGLTAGRSDFQVSTFYTENQSGSHRRNTTGIRADLDFAISDNLVIGGEFFYSEGDSSRADFDAKGFGLDAAYRGKLGKLDWEVGLGAGLVRGDLTRDYDFGTFSPESQQDSHVLTAHTALRNSNRTLAGLDAYWEIGLKQRFVRRSGASESGAASLDFSYSGESLHTTLANLEMGLHLSSKLNLELALNPVLFHNGGEIEARQSTGLADFSTSDHSGYDVHTARASLIFSPTDSSAITTDFVIGSGNTWATNLAYRLRF